MGRRGIERSESELRADEPLTVLYGAVLRSLARAKRCIEEDDQIGQVVEVKKVTNLLTHLQAALRTERSRSASVSLSDFYAAMFTLTLEASQCESTEGLDEVIGYVTQVRDAWVLSLGELKRGRTIRREMQPYPMHSAAMLLHA